MNDISRVAQVSLATVDRVLNGRPGVREKTIAKVRAAIDELGYVRDVSAANLAKSKEYHFAFLLPQNGAGFAQALAKAVSSASDGPQSDRAVLEVRTFDRRDANALPNLMGELGEDVDGVAVFADETPQVRDAIAHLSERGIAVVALGSDLPSTTRDHFVGIDNVAAGRTAGVLLGRFVSTRPARLLVVGQSLQSRQAIDRRFGFDAILAERFSGIDALPTMELQSAQALERLETILAAGGIDGIYALSSSDDDLLNLLRRQPKGARPVLIAHDFSPAHADALEMGLADAVIGQDVGHLVRSSIRVMRAKRDERPIDTAQERIRIEVIFKENMPPIH